MKGGKNRFIWFIIFLILIAVTLYAMMSGATDFTAERFWELLSGANPWYMLCAFLSIAGFVFFEAWSLWRLTRFFGHKRSLGRNMIYSAADIYFSAITPSATGGQPASALFMMRDGIPGAVTAMCLLLNVMLYTVSILIIGVLCFILCPGVFFSFNMFSRLLIIIGFGIQALVVVALLLLVLKEQIILRLASFFIRLLHKLHLMKDVEKRLASVERMAAEYKECIRAFRGGGWVVFRVLLLNLMQRFCNIAVTLFVYLATGGSISRWLEVFVTQGYVVLGSNAVPIPGAVGVADMLFLDGFEDIIVDTTCVELISRSVSFYICLIACGAVTLGAVVFNMMKKRKRRKNEQ